MINTKDQEELFRLVAEYLSKSVVCVAIGGTAMMFKNYKATTKDIDLVFQNDDDRFLFIDAIKKLGYVEVALGNIYDARRKENNGGPLMFSRGDERFDLFVKDVFGYVIDFNQEKITDRTDFLGNKELSILLLSDEELVLLKSITGREKDYEDIETILDIKKNIDWNLLVHHAIAQKKNNSWILIYLEETLQNLKKKYFIKSEIFNLIYDSQEQ